MPSWRSGVLGASLRWCLATLGLCWQTVVAAPPALEWRSTKAASAPVRTSDGPLSAPALAPRGAVRLVGVVPRQDLEVHALPGASSAPVIQQVSHSILARPIERLAQRNDRPASRKEESSIPEARDLFEGSSFDPFDVPEGGAEESAAESPPAESPSSPTDAEEAAPEAAQEFSPDTDFPRADSTPPVDAPLPAESAPPAESIPETDFKAQGAPAAESFDSPADADSENVFEESQEAIDRELQRRQSQQDFADELPEDNAFEDDEPMTGGEPSEEIPDPKEDWDPSDAERRPADELPDAPSGVEDDDKSGEERKLTPEQEKKRREQIAEERTQSAKDCRQLLEQVRSVRIDSIDLDIRVKGEPGEDFPFDCQLGEELFAGRSWGQVTYLWKASGLCHKPLYFEQVQLERYGHCWGPYVQPIMSGVHFFCSVPILPYKMGIQTPNECVYSLGYYRPGSCAPYMIDAVPFTLRAALFQGTVATGLPFIIP